MATLCNISDVPEVWVLVPRLLFSETVRDVAQTLKSRHGGEFAVQDHIMGISAHAYQRAVLIQGVTAPYRDIF